MAKVLVISGGAQTMVQDLGRIRYQKMGMPVAGVMDNYAARCANILVGNSENAALLEAVLLGPELKFLDKSIVAVTGADMSAEINGVKIKMWKSYLINSGDVLKLYGAKSGIRAYIAFSGGIDVPLVMDSCSTYIKAGIGGFKGRALKSGDELNINDVPIHSIKELNGNFIPSYGGNIVLQAVPGPHTEYFSHEGNESFFTQTYTVGSRSDRMGIFLEGEQIELKNETSDILSSAILMGSIQITNDRTPVILMADRQTTGGYAQIATVITPDLPRAAQAKAGDKITFQRMSVEEARKLYIEYEQKIAAVKDGLGSGMIVKSLSTQNLHLNGDLYKVIIEETTKSSN